MNLPQNIFLFNHPLIKTKISQIRAIETPSKLFKELVDEIAALMCYEITKEWLVESIEIQTPVSKAEGFVLSGKDPVLVPILRAGLGMVDGFYKLIPTAKIGHIGLYRDHESLLPVQYLCKLPNDLAERNILLLDPMLATGGSAAKAVDILKENGAKKIQMVCLVGCPEGVELMAKQHPDVPVYLAAFDEKLNEKGYIVPGLGDAGDRLFGTL